MAASAVCDRTSRYWANGFPLPKVSRQQFQARWSECSAKSELIPKIFSVAFELAFINAIPEIRLIVSLFAFSAFFIFIHYLPADFQLQ